MIIIIIIIINALIRLLIIREQKVDGIREDDHDAWEMVIGSPRSAIRPSS